MVRRLLRILGVVLVVAALLVLGGLALIETGWFKHKVRDWAMAAANHRLNGQLTIGRISGSLLSGIELHDVSLAMEGGTAFTIPTITVKYRLAGVIAAGHVIDEIDVHDPEIFLRHGAHGWNLGHLTRPSPSSSGNGPTLGIRRIVLENGTLHVDTGPSASASGSVRWPSVLQPLNGEIRLGVGHHRLEFGIERLSFQAGWPQGASPTAASGVAPSRGAPSSSTGADLRAGPGGLAVSSLTGGFTIAPDVFVFDRLMVQSDMGTFHVDGAVPKSGHEAPFDLHLRTDALDLPTLARFVPRANGIPLTPSIDLSAKGPLPHLALDLDFGSSAGHVAAHLVANLADGARQMGGAVRLTRLNLAPLLKKPGLVSDITAAVDTDATFGSGPFSLRYRFQAPHAMVAGYQATAIAARGFVDRAGVQLDASGQAYGGRVTSAGRLTFPTGSGHRVRFDLNGRTAAVDLSTLPAHLGLRKLPTRLNFGYTLKGEWPKLQGQFALDASTALGATIAAGDTGSFSLVGPELQYAAAGELSHLDLQRVGRSFDIDALTTDRYRTDLSGRFDLRVTGTTLARLALEATADLHSSSAFDGRVVRATAAAHLHDRRLTVRTNGLFDAIDLEQAFAIPEIWGRAAGTVDGTVIFADLSQPTGVDDVEWNGAIDLTDSVLEGLPIDLVSFDGRYARRRAEIRKLHVAAPLVEGQAHGTFDLTATGASQLSYDIAQLDLAALGARLGRSLSGLATLHGTLTGNAGLLTTSGHVTGAPVAFDRAQAVDIEADYQASLPDFDRTRLRGRATISLDTLALSARTLAETITVQAAYDDSRLTFRGSVQNPRATVSAAGSWTPAAAEHPVQLIDLTALTIATPGSVWELAKDYQPHIEVGADRLAVSGVRLLHQGESISADGVLGMPGQTLRVGISRLDLSTLNRVLPSAPPMAGTLESAEATLSGALAHPVADVSIAVSDGAYRSIRGISVSGTGHYERGRIGLDVRVAQAETGVMTVAGQVPASLFGGGARSSSDPFDLTITGDRIALGLLTGLTDAVTDVTGTANANVRIAGTTAAPTASGTIDVTGGAFTLAAARVHYDGLTARLALAGDRVRIERLVLHDPRGHTLQATGALAVQAGKVSLVEASVEAGDFTVIDNDLASVDIDARVQLLGELVRPRVQGTVTLRAARLNADTLLAIVGRGATAAEPLIPVERVPVPGAAAPNVALGPPEPVPSLASSLALDLTVRAPDTLVVTGSNLTGNGSAIGVGSLNLTLGGTVRVQKAPRAPILIAGTMNTVRGSYAFQGRRFDIQQGGQIQFRGLSPVNPVLNVGATQTIAGVQTRVNLEGALRTPRLTLSSSPPLDEADILSLIVFNQPINQLAEQQQASLVSRASLMAAGALASSVAQSIGRALNLDIFEIEPSPATGATAALTVGQQIGARLFLKVSQSLGRESATQFTIDYFLTSFMRLQSEITQGPLNTQTLLARTDRTSVELVFFFSY